MIFLDNASTTRVFENAAEAMKSVYLTEYFNPSATYSAAVGVKRLIDHARLNIALKLNALPEEIFFTSCATESNTWAINNGFKNKKGNIVISSGEHASVYENAIALKGRGADVRFVPLLKDGTIDMVQLSKIADENTSLISVIHCSNETGAINDIAQINSYLRKKCPNALFHSDGVQAFCKIETDVKKLGVDMYSLSAHKIGGAKGVGILYIKKPLKISPLIIGGGQEIGARSGTENTAGIVGFSVAIEEFSKNYNKEYFKLMRDLLRNALISAGAIINESQDNSVHILSASFSGLKAEILQSLLSNEDIFIGLGSACSGKTKNNRVLSAMGLGQSQIEGSLRLSLGCFNTVEEIEYASKKIIEKVYFLRGKIFG